MVSTYLNNDIKQNAFQINTHTCLLISWLARMLLFGGQLYHETKSIGFGFFRFKWPASNNEEGESLNRSLSINSLHWKSKSHGTNSHTLTLSTSNKFSRTERIMAWNYWVCHLEWFFECAPIWLKIIKLIEKATCQEQPKRTNTKLMLKLRRLQKKNCDVKETISTKATNSYTKEKQHLK